MQCPLFLDQLLHLLVVALEVLLALCTLLLAIVIQRSLQMFAALVERLDQQIPLAERLLQVDEFLLSSIINPLQII
ncbi:hypothetical protein D3C76_1722310 [compost metagenome]